MLGARRRADAAVSALGVGLAGRLLERQRFAAREGRPAMIPSVSPAPPARASQVETLADGRLSVRDGPEGRRGASARPSPRESRAPGCIGRVFGGRFRVDRFIARGGMGAIWEAADLRSLGSRVALKTLTDGTTNPKAHARFRSEVALAASLAGRHFPRVQGYGVEGGVPYLAMDLLEGETLRERMVRTGTLSIADCRWLVREVCEALSEAHDFGAIHRDITPKNLFIAKGSLGEELKVLDLGIAKHALFDTRVTEPGMLVGSPHYMSPEQIMGSKPWPSPLEPNVSLGESILDPRSDLWALAVVVYEALVGRRPFVGKTTLDVIDATLRQTPARPSETRPELGRMLDGFFQIALAKDRDARLPTASAFAAAFDVATSDATKIARAASVLVDDVHTVIGERAAPPHSPEPKSAGSRGSRHRPRLRRAPASAHRRATSPTRERRARAARVTRRSPRHPPRAPHLRCGSEARSL
ncbi:MAG: serine/threonine-protein kinase [Polyangiaceae bacterium]